MTPSAVTEVPSRPVHDFQGFSAAQTAAAVHPFDTGIALARRERDFFAASISPDWNVIRGPNGGFLAALLLEAALQRLEEPSRRPRSFTVHYPAVPKPGAVEIRTRVEREGRSVSWVSVELYQDGSLCVAARGAFSKEWPGVAFETAAFPWVSPPETGLAMTHGMPPFTRHYDYRSLFALPGEPGSHGRVGGWIRPRPERPFDAPLLAALTDAWFPSTFAHDPRPVLGATLDLTIHFRDYAAIEQLDAGAYVLSVFSSRLSTEGFFEEDGELWSPDGRLLVQSRQMALAAPIGGDAPR